MGEYKPKYFTMDELTVSATARAYGIINMPDDEVRRNLLLLTEKILDPMREMWGSRIWVNSGYRSSALNAKLSELGYHPSEKSQHMRGLAADVTVGGVDENRKLFMALANSGIIFGQVIAEDGFKWLHVALDGDGRGAQRMNVLVGNHGKYSRWNG